MLRGLSLRESEPHTASTVYAARLSLPGLRTGPHVDGEEVEASTSVVLSGVNRQGGRSGALRAPLVFYLIYQSLLTRGAEP